ncbi:hypothetical protein AVENP_1006 [Arcobacter venerupis]|uniref:Uncharacterized protein n=1 Tax=Arcobacter venerupis TaxID=1054033 RepID=A0AAE7E420_9BACT|nr:hypothetical protein [Arcobacter venerupis]QKF66562.1 hypothetical protein AVENP_1006 [Arcobacter venerupis]RWS49701.1 hypothetical protein CKA56_08250 [Arcobacter venerupis]
MEKIEIAKRWLEKSKKYNNTDVEEVMDKFFSLYVSYNAIYSKFSQGSANDDRSCATTKMAEYLKRENITILNDCESTVKKMIAPIKNGSFYIYGNHSGQDFKKDNVIIQKIEEDINNYASILNFIYGLRSNMFHGEKQIIGEQIQLLNPANIILEKLLDALIKKILTN